MLLKLTTCERLGVRTLNVMDRTCRECELLLQAYEQATHSQRIIEQKSATESGLESLALKASNRREEARKAVEDHEAAHITGAASQAVGPS